MMQRNMSYRKPVPIYVPSPPPSPDPSSTAAEAPSPPPPPPPSLAELVEVPPLPVNWRRVLDEHSSQQVSRAAEPTELATKPVKPIPNPMERSVSDLPPPVPSKDDIAPVWIKKEDQDVDFSLTDISQDISQIEFFRPRYISQDTDGVSNHSRPSLNGPRLNTRQRKRSLLHQQYRPPTPPLPSLKRSTATPQPIYTPTEDMTFSSQISSHYHGSETLLSHSFDGLDRHHIPPPIYPFKSHIASTSLRISPSFNTEKTVVSINTNHSGGWRSGMGSCDTGANSCPTLLIPHNLDNRFKFSKPSPQADTVSCWSGLEVWMKKIGDVIVHRKGS